jgi:y4mF family transcriptional regulator
VGLYRQDIAGRRLVDDFALIGAGIRSARKDAGLSQEDLAHLAGTSQRTIRAIETGTGNPSLKAVVAAANVLGLHVAVR